MGKWTKGPVHVGQDERCFKRHHSGYAIYENGALGIMIAETVNGLEPGEAKANADLFAEACNVATETGLSPRQLADSRKELREALQACEKEMRGCEVLVKSRSWRAAFIEAQDKAQAALCRAEQQEQK